MSGVTASNRSVSAPPPVTDLRQTGNTKKYSIDMCDRRLRSFCLTIFFLALRFLPRLYSSRAASRRFMDGRPRSCPRGRQCRQNFHSSPPRWPTSKKPDGSGASLNANQRSRSLLKSSRFASWLSWSWSLRLRLDSREARRSGRAMLRLILSQFAE